MLKYWCASINNCFLKVETSNIEDYCRRTANYSRSDLFEWEQRLKRTKMVESGARIRSRGTTQNNKGILILQARRWGLQSHRVEEVDRMGMKC